MKVILINLEHCLGCKSCELACAVEHSASKDIFAAIFEKRLPVSRVHVEAGRQFNFPLRRCTMYQSLHQRCLVAGGRNRPDQTYPGKMCRLLDVRDGLSLWFDRPGQKGAGCLKVRSLPGTGDPRLCRGVSH